MPPVPAAPRADAAVSLRTGASCHTVTRSAAASRRGATFAENAVAKDRPLRLEHHDVHRSTAKLLEPGGQVTEQAMMLRSSSTTSVKNET